MKDLNERIDEITDLLMSAEAEPSPQIKTDRIRAAKALMDLLVSQALGERNVIEQAQQIINSGASPGNPNQKNT